MKIQRNVKINNTIVDVLISDDTKTLQTAGSAGRVVIGLINKQIPHQDFTGISYLIQTPEALTDEYVKLVAMRQLGLPWKIRETRYLIIREFIKEESSILDKWKTFGCFETGQESLDNNILDAYIKNQYYFYEYGIWLLIDKSRGIPVGQAGISNFRMDGKTELELGYYIDKDWRRKGYGKEACEAIIDYTGHWLEPERLYCRIDPFNTASIRLAESLGFYYKRVYKGMSLYEMVL